jgi:hypothetical protein
MMKKLEDVFWLFCRQDARPPGRPHDDQQGLQKDVVLFQKKIKKNQKKKNHFFFKRVCLLKKDVWKNYFYWVDDQ